LDIALSGATHGDKMFVLDYAKIYVYLRTDSGTTAPAATITSGEIGSLNGIAYDPILDEILVSSLNTTSFAVSVLAFPSGSNGSTVPSRKLSSSQLLFAAGIAVDSTNNMLYVTDSLRGAVLAFSRSFTGTPGAPVDTTPTWTLVGSATQLMTNYSQKIAWDSANSEIAPGIQ
jgi:DNA-binding beta-propeller fold protein YncE